MRIYIPKCNRIAVIKQPMPQGVYLMLAGSSLKIGIASNPRHRVREVQTGCPDRVMVVFFYRTDAPARQVEQTMHRHFSSYRKFGEWFDAAVLDQAKQFLRSLPGAEILEVEVNLEHAPNAKKFHQRRINYLKRMAQRKIINVTKRR